MKVASVVWLFSLVSITKLVNADTSKWTKFRVKFSLSGVLEDVSAFWTVNSTLGVAEDFGWERIKNPDEPDLVTVCLSQKDVRFCPMYDQNGFIAGVQLAVPINDVERTPYKFGKSPTFHKKTINGRVYYTSALYLSDPENFSTGGRNELDNLGEGIWIKNGTNYTQVPTDEEELRSNTKYVRNNCIPNMGTHYFYDTRREQKCSDFPPFFMLVKDGNINGIGWQVFGITDVVDRDWYNFVDRQAAYITAPLGPQCLADWTDKFGVISVHMYFVDKPWTIRCDNFNDNAVPLDLVREFILNSLYVVGDVEATWRKATNRN